MTVSLVLSLPGKAYAAEPAAALSPANAVETVGKNAKSTDKNAEKSDGAKSKKGDIIQLPKLVGEAQAAEPEETAAKPIPASESPAAPGTAADTGAKEDAGTGSKEGNAGSSTSPGTAQPPAGEPGKGAAPENNPGKPAEAPGQTPAAPVQAPAATTPPAQAKPKPVALPESAPAQPAAPARPSASQPQQSVPTPKAAELQPSAESPLVPKAEPPAAAPAGPVAARADDQPREAISRQVNPLVLSYRPYPQPDRNQYPAAGLDHRTTTLLLSLAAVLAVTGSALFLAPVPRRRNRIFHRVKVSAR